MIIEFTFTRLKKLCLDSIKPKRTDINKKKTTMAQFKVKRVPGK